MAFISAQQLSDGCFHCPAKLTVPFGGFLLQLVFRGGDTLWITEKVTHRLLFEQRDQQQGWLNRGFGINEVCARFVSFDSIFHFHLNQRKTKDAIFTAIKLSFYV